MHAEATILHADADAFFASVEQRDDPSLRGRPVIVGGGVVMAANYEARSFGIRSGMGGSQWRRLCPHAAVVSPHFDAYAEASEALFDVFRDTSPVVEGLSLEEAFMDVRGLEQIKGSPLQIANRLRRDVFERVGLPLSVGVARTKNLAKMASRAAKPDGLLAVPPARELEFLHPLPVDSLWGVGGATAAKLHGAGLETVGQLARLPERSLIEVVGSATGRHLHAIANARDPRPVRSGGRRRSFGAQSAFGLGRRSFDEAEPILIALVDRVTGRMRTAGRTGRTVVLRLRFGDYSRASRSRTLERPTSSSRPIATAARILLSSARPVIERRGLTMIGITISNLNGDVAGIQLELPLFRRERAELDAALDEISRRFGSSAVRRATGLRQTLERGDPVSH